MKTRSIYFLMGLTLATWEAQAQCTTSSISTNGPTRCRLNGVEEILPQGFVNSYGLQSNPFQTVNQGTGLTVWGNDPNTAVDVPIASFRALRWGDQSAHIQIRASRGAAWGSVIAHTDYLNWDANPNGLQSETVMASAGAGRSVTDSHSGFYAISTNDGTSGTNLVQGIYLDHNQNVGLGNSSAFNNSSLPTHRLDVDGDARIRTIPIVDEYDYVLVTDMDGDVQKVDPSLLTGTTDLDWVVAGTSNTLASSLANDIRTDGMVGIGMNPTSTINYGSGSISNVRLAVNGSIYCTGIASSSDARLKTNITLVTNALEKLNSISGYSYNFIQDHGTVLNLPESHQVGVLAQEVRSVLPEAVSELENGYLTVNYDMLVPLLIESVKELSQEVENLKSAQAMSNPQATSLMVSSISQNFPNPTSGETVFSISLAGGVQSAQILITDLTGKMIEKVDVNNQGKFELTYNCSSLDNGIYIYALVANNQVVDSKRMVVSK